MAVLQLEGISKHFGNVQALEGVTFSVEEGEFVGLVGENGAGKSTLMKIISGYYPHGQYQGRLRIMGREAVFAGPRDAENARLEMIYQEINMHLDLTVAENLCLGRWPKNAAGLVSWKQTLRHSARLLELVGADFPPGELMRNLNVGRQQQVAIARALLRRPLLLILDEPTSVLTEREADVLFALLHRLNAQEKLTVMLISHRLREVFDNTTRIVTLRDGRTVGDHRTSDTSKDEIVCEMVGRQISSFFFKKSVPTRGVVLEVKGLSVPHPYIARANLLEHISFQLHGGEILGIAGLMGSGRSELVNAVFGKGRRTAGEVSVNGRIVAEGSRREAIERGIGLVPEDRKKDGCIAVQDIKSNITLASLGKVSRAGFIRGKTERNEAGRLFAQLRVKAPNIDFKVGQLSGGNQQKVVIAKWLLAESTVLLLDDPTRGVDVGAKEEIYHLIGELVERGIGIVLISSDLPELLALSDRLLVLRRGRISAEIPRADFSSERVMTWAV